MGMYTRFVFAADLKIKNKVDSNALKYMMDYNRDEPAKLPDHPLFNDVNSRWRFMLRGGSYYHVGCSTYKLIKDSFDNNYRISVDCNFKNYSTEIYKFLDWVKKFIDPTDYPFPCGYILYEEDESFISVIWLTSGGLEVKTHNYKDGETIW